MDRGLVSDRVMNNEVGGVYEMEICMYIQKHVRHLTYMPTYIHICVFRIREAGIEPAIASPYINTFTYTHIQSVIHT